MSTLWALRREELLSDCLVSPDVFPRLVERLAEEDVSHVLGPLRWLAQTHTD